jgi:hypothetical protein
LFAPRCGRVCSEIAWSFPAAPGLRLAAVFLQTLDAALVEFFASAEFGDGLIGILAVLLAVLTEAADNFTVEVLGALDLDGIDALFDADGLEALVPSGIQIRRGDGEAIALEAGPHRQRVAAGTGI